MPDIENSRKKQPKRVPSGSRYNSRKTAGKTPKHPKNSQNSCFSGVSAVFPAVFRLLSPWPTRHPFRLFFRLFLGCFQCRAFGTSVGGHRDCNHGLSRVVAMADLLFCGLGFERPGRMLWLHRQTLHRATRSDEAMPKYRDLRRPGLSDSYFWKV